MENKQSVPHIVQFQGSKRMFARQILQYFPNNFERLVEPFAGMAAITIAAAKEKMAKRYHLNDLNEPLVELLREAIEKPCRLVDDYATIWHEQFSFADGNIEHYYKIRADFNRGYKSAANMLYLLARCTKGSVCYNDDGDFNQSPDKRRSGVSPDNLAKNVRLVSSYLKGRVTFSSIDYREVLDDVKQGDIVYMDPPHQGVCQTRDCRYFSGIDFAEFVDSVERLNRRGVDFIISYDGSCGDKQYGSELPRELGLKKVELSSQGVLLGRKDATIETLYISRNLQ